VEAYMMFFGGGGGFKGNGPNKKWVVFGIHFWQFSTRVFAKSGFVVHGGFVVSLKELWLYFNQG